MARVWNKIIICVAVVAAVVLGVLMVTDPAVKTPAPKQAFDANRAWAHLEQIAQEPHSVFDRDALEAVRQYIIGQIEAVGLTPERVRHGDQVQRNAATGEDETVEIHNIYAQIDGTSGQYILLMAHYDSSPYKVKYGEVTEGSRGASDDGYGVATLLEVMRAMQAGGQPVNGVKFVFTDAEETGLSGAEALVKENAAYIADVNLFVNVEARGTRGPLYMFQTSANNQNIIRLFAGTQAPFSFSIASEVYKYLPSDTDLTPVLDAGYPAMNFSTLNDLRYYHTKDDTLENASIRTLQLYGDEIGSLVTAYAAGAAYSSADSFAGKGDSVFFTLLPGRLIHYSTGISWAAIIATLVLAAVILWLANRRGLLQWKEIFKSFGLWACFIVVAAALGFLAVWIPCLVTGSAFRLMFMPYVPFDRGFLAIAMIALAALSHLCVRMQKKRRDARQALGGGILLNCVILIVFAFVLHGGTYLFLWPTLLSLLVFATLAFEKKTWHAVLRLCLTALLVFFTVLEFFLFIYSFFLAMTIGALVIMAFLAAIPLAILAPLPSLGAAKEN